jgi:putative NIF3 family GTP cyclohydrolase 1 type 2
LVQKIAIISGGGVYEVDQAIDAGVDLYITGDANHVIYHRCMEAGIHVVFAGHYLTETWGPRAVMDTFIQETGLAACFIDVPTGL